MLEIFNYLEGKLKVLRKFRKLVVTARKYGDVSTTIGFVHDAGTK